MLFLALKKDSNGQNHSLSDSHYPVNPPHSKISSNPLTLFGKLWGDRLITYGECRGFDPTSRPLLRASQLDVKATWSQRQVDR